MNQKSILNFLLLLLFIAALSMPIVFMYFSTMTPAEVWQKTWWAILYGFFAWFFGRAVIETSFKNLK